MRIACAQMKTLYTSKAEPVLPCVLLPGHEEAKRQNAGKDNQTCFSGEGTDSLNLVFDQELVGVKLNLPSITAGDKSKKVAPGDGVALGIFTLASFHTKRQRGGNSLHHFPRFSESRWVRCRRWTRSKHCGAKHKAPFCYHGYR